MFWVYVLQSLKDNDYYIGHTHNLEQRVLRHNSGRVKSTKVRKPLMLVLNEEYKTKSEAVRREGYLKSLKGNTTFKRIIGNA